MTDRCRLLILEDNPGRTAAMQERLRSRFPQYETLILADAPAFIAALNESIGRVIAISLDHDLEPQPGGADDPGTGRDAADFLVQSQLHLRQVPILLHTTNIPAADGMERVLLEAGYVVDRIVPYGDLDWISEAWFPMFRRHILQAAEASNRTAPETAAVVKVVSAVP